MRSVEGSLSLPPAMTYLLARAVADAERRMGAGGVPSTTRLDRLLRDAVRHLTGSGASTAEAMTALRDVGEALAASCSAPAARVAFAEAVRQATPDAFPR